ncbi:MAG TPA: DUF885 domain-containing protein [Novosphingobium sp.]|nr:DUF885 domain-containing protein [Novosphingobium sp.]
MMLRRPFTALLLATALASCNMAPTAGTTAQAPWAEFTKAAIDGWLKQDPYFAVYQGAHQYDGKFADWTAAGLKARGDFLRKVIADAKGYDKLEGRDRFERDYMVKVAEGQLFWLETADQPHTNPGWYVGAFDPNVYLTREYADKPTRAKALAQFLEGVPAAAAQIKANLKGPIAAPLVTYGVSAFQGYAEFYPKDALSTFADVEDPALQQRLKDASAKAAAAMSDLATWLKGQEGANASFALGPDRFAQMLRDTEAVDVPLDQLEAVGEADLKRNRDALKAACDQFAPGQTIPACMDKMGANKPVGGAVAEATSQIPMLTAFVKEKDLVSIPGTEQALVRQSPPYNAQNGAYIDPPGPYEKGIPSIYYIAAPDPSWPADKQADYIPGKDDLMFTSIHEVMPGHFLQFLHANRAPSFFGRLFVGYAFAEGWAHYSEEMMWEAGLGNGDPEIHIGQLSNALLRDCRFLSAIRLHTKGMTIEQSTRFFQDACYQGEGTAEQQARRGAYDPAYLNYTLGKLMIRKLREDWTATRGGRQGWKAFHDEFLTYGGPPIPLVRQAMMKEDAPKAVF